MAVKTETTRSVVSDISGRTLSQHDQVKISIKSNGDTWMLDAGRDEELIVELLSFARNTTGYGRSQQSRSNGDSNN